MKNDVKRERRINQLHQRALNKKYTKDGKFLTSELINDAIQMGVSKSTAKSYVDAVITRLQKGGHLS